VYRRIVIVGVLQCGIEGTSGAIAGICAAVVYDVK
jgi:hypothetical protein